MDLFQNTDDDDSGMYKTETQAKQNVLNNNKSIHFYAILLNFLLVVI